MSALHTFDFGTFVSSDFDLIHSGQPDSPLIREMGLEEYISMLNAVKENNITYPEYHYSLQPQNNTLEAIQLYCNSSSALNSNDAVQFFHAYNLQPAAELKLVPSNECKSIALDFNANSSMEFSGTISGIG